MSRSHCCQRNLDIFHADPPQWRCSEQALVVAGVSVAPGRHLTITASVTQACIMHRRRFVSPLTIDP
ncbi:hypothetical protein LNP56_28180 [Klebsiella pneumoniae subsp. pneumoniae]|nr:hypothetical protein [Klebsiella pneumoniae subsp. pneumoniae]